MLPYQGTLPELNIRLMAKQVDLTMAGYQRLSVAGWDANYRVVDALDTAQIGE